jgi:hypothetical protein
MQPRSVLFAIVLNEEGRAAAMTAAASGKARAATRANTHLLVHEHSNTRHSEPCGAAMSALAAHTRWTHAAVTNEHDRYAFGELGLNRTTRT